jgi:hypothetical protein
MPPLIVTIHINACVIMDIPPAKVVDLGDGFCTPRKCGLLYIYMHSFEA